MSVVLYCARNHWTVPGGSSPLSKLEWSNSSLRHVCCFFFSTWFLKVCKDILFDVAPGALWFDASHVLPLFALNFTAQQYWPVRTLSICGSCLLFGLKSFPLPRTLWNNSLLLSPGSSWIWTAFLKFQSFMYLLLNLYIYISPHTICSI